MLRWVRVIQLRADQRFGELSLLLEKAERARRPICIPLLESRRKNTPWPLPASARPPRTDARNWPAA
jgi:hypothetical protein